MRQSVTQWARRETKQSRYVNVMVCNDRCGEMANSSHQARSAEAIIAGY